MRKGISALKACKKIDLAQSTFTLWCNEDPSLAEEYARAREDLQEVIACEILEIADEEVPKTASGATDNGAVNKQRLRVDTRKWVLSKLAPKKWGDRVQIAGDDTAPLKVETLDVTKLSTTTLAEILAARNVKQE